MIALNDTGLFRQQAWIDGKWTDARSGKTIAVTNPADGSSVGTVPAVSAQEVRQTIDAADRALPAWRRRTAKERSEVLHRWYRLMMDHQEDLAAVLTSEQGKPLAEARGEIAFAASFMQWFAEEAKRVYGDTIPATSADQRIIVLRQPVGVCAAITPWNFPAAMIARKAAPALAAGCTIVVKPASQTPLTALALAELSQRAGVPAGVFNVITGSAGIIGGELTASPIVRKLSFTGSTEVGRTLMAQSGATIKKVSLELGGNAPFIVFDDADLDQAVQGAMVSKYRNTGQTCVCANRIFVQDGVYDDFSRRFVAEVQKLKVGRGVDPGVQQGPLIDDSALAKVSRHIDDALSRGATLLTGGKPHALGGTFFQPTVLGDVDADMDVAADETFGPVAPLIRFSSEADAIRMANDTPYGLAAYFYARDFGRIFRVSEALEFGMVGINAGLISTEVAPFGGIKQSGIGREGSRYGMEEYLEMKYLCLAGIEG
ncbi:NAD-dependent succinate-semialdehyde dehydrogenase [Desulfosarcina alkanivorans]|uniref:NAD-dependent succinate-semialdehyde dehydrogenase n=1 Tax=Desulfosarcina alkanivorans TaxID=571177 RepID=A0A5K7YUT3_9BACT|nr:NADP-dependent succinate-semialdehyde dehydrogenase [Desulfosarcina alkanivorans]BBO70064.1 NAD-dependent succinate-semialdehyde dehydrogenase [Desulfosarcina alkanivorans]